MFLLEGLAVTLVGFIGLHILGWLAFDVAPAAYKAASKLLRAPYRTGHSPLDIRQRWTIQDNGDLTGGPDDS